MYLKILAVLILFLHFTASGVIGIVDPQSTSNNKLGVHVLDPDEIGAAADLVNAGDGDWGYITVPIQASDRDRDKWGRFFKEARERHLIPIIRVATVPSGANWDQANNYDLVDFANFLDDLPWPTRNRYVVIFNEVNRASEWGGFVEPERYADILANAITIFKQRSEDFFILPAGLDNAAPNNHELMRWRDYLNRMAAQQPDIFDRIDGWTSHAYPNPAFSGRPTDYTDRSISSFKFDLQHLTRFTSKKLPVFITETGWDMSRVPPQTVATYYQRAFDGPWADPRVVAVTPFLLHAGDGPFVVFSLTGDERRPVFDALAAQATRGEPELAPLKLAEAPVSTQLQTRAASFWERYQELIEPINQSWSFFRDLFTGWLLDDPESVSSIKVGDREYRVDIADTPLLRQRGLSGRPLLAPDEGMFFIFPSEGHHVFWMKDMRFNIDIVWIADDQVIGISPAYASTPRQLYTPPRPVRYVLEVSANSGIRVGDKVELNL
jgi:uncharacterized membrane protein (UPF0127 family)